MANGTEFQEKVKQVGSLIAQFERLPDGPQKSAGEELVRLMMDVHAAGLERVMEIVFESSASGQTLIDKLGQDAVVGSLLLLYSLHPDQVETRVQKAIEALRPRLRKLACSIELLGTVDGNVRLKLTVTGHKCGSTTKDLKAMVEDGVLEFAPDVESIEILGLEEPSASGFVALESLSGKGVVSALPREHLIEAGGGD